MMRRRLPALALGMSLALAACAQATTDAPVEGALAAAPPPAPTTTLAPTTTTTTTVPETPYQFQEDLESHGTMVALLTESVEVYGAPGDDEPYMVQDGLTWFGANQVLALVDKPEDGWAEVILPGRPNGRTGWIKAEERHFYVVGGSIVIDLSERTLVYLVDGEEVLRTPVAIGTDRNPTPPGHYFVTDSIRVPGNAGPFGPYALALSARSDTISEFNGGDGIIGIHGTNRPNLIGQAVSLGCIRLPNGLMTRLWELVPIGTPVEIRG